jgi:hypothetical protein
MQPRFEERVFMPWYETGVLIYAALLVVFLLAWTYIPA